MSDVNIFATDIQEKVLVSHGFGDIISSPFLQRLKGVSFLSTLDYVYDLNPISSRYDHSIGTAYVALLLAQHLELSDFQTNVLVIANLLHDIGHAPFSHNSEPFLVEQKGVYHNGLISTYLRSNFQVSGGYFSLRDLLRDKPQEVTDAVTQLIRKKPTGDAILDDLHHNPINADKIEGTNRTLISLGVEYVDPGNLISCFSKDGDMVAVLRCKLDNMLKFWECQQKVYWTMIYTNEVFACEAMLTRALEFGLTSSQGINDFILSTDSEVLEVVKGNPISNQIITWLFNKDYFMPMSAIMPDKYLFYKDEVRKARSDKARRRLIETDIAKDLQVNPDFMITHFSQRKQFFQDYSLLFQTSLFDNNEYISIDVLRKSLYADKVSADYQEIFFRQPI